MEDITVAFAGGGTGGHIYPGLAVAAELRALFRAESNGQFLQEMQEQEKLTKGNIRIVWIGSGKGMDGGIVFRAVDANGKSIVDKFYGIRAGKLRRYFSWRNLSDTFKVLLGFFDSISCLIKERPALLFSKGGFVSVPPCAAAKLLGIKVFTHECDITPGLATKLNCRAANKVLLSYPETAKYIKEKYRVKTAVTGNPVRDVFYHADAKRGLDFLGIKDKKKPIVFFMGGSQGAKQINALVEENLDWLCERYTVIHQTGETADTKDFASGASKEDVRYAADYHPYKFIYNEMPDVLMAADIAVSRAGAGALWECAVLKKPMVLIPLCGAGTRGDQVDNAKYFESKGAAIALCGGEATGERLRCALKELTSEKRQEMSAKCAEMTQTMSAKTIAKMIYDETVCKISNKGE